MKSRSALVFWWGNLRARYYLEDLNVDVRIVLQSTRMGGMEWIHEVHDRPRGRLL
jgi:hypothetical protein